MRPGYQKLLLLITGLSFFAVSYFLFFPANHESEFNEFEKYEDESQEARSEINKERWKYYFDMLRDPATNKIPPQIRQRELKFAEQLSAANLSLKKSISTNITWKEAGPIDVGGRTRALAVDLQNPNTVIAGGVSGGIWKSTDNGSSWKLKSTTNQLLSITAIAQDPRNGQTNTWYASGGEFDGSAQDLGYTALFTGDGFYKSTDNGDSWNLLQNTSDQNVANFNQFSYSSRIVISPTTGSIFIANNGFGVLRSTDGGTSFTQVLGGPGHHIYSDVGIASNGILVAALSIPFNNITPTETAGVYKSTDDGASWTNITPNDYPATPQRAGLAITPSNPDKFYILTNTGTVDADKKNVLKFYKGTISSGSFEDRSANLPDFTGQGQGYEKGFVELQGNYNLTVAVKPDDENFVLLAGTGLFRSANGFSSKPNDAVKDWIGGYNPQTFFYPNFHPDIHSFSFDPTNPKKMWWGNDGGLAYTTDITNTSFTSLFPWENKNNGYDVTQYYTIAISKDANDDRIMGGCQDNGTPFFRFDGSTTTPHVDVSLGDGTFSYLASNFAYAETQNGNLLRLHYDQSGNIPGLFDNNNYSTITPSNAANQTFVNPFTVDPADEDVMYYLAGPDIWRNNQLSSIPDGVYQTDVGWTKLDNLSAAQGLNKTTIAVSTSPAHILYFAESGDNTTKPKIFKLQNANTSTSSAVDISIPDAPAGAYVHHIAVNPDDANEIIVVMSNYNIVGLYHSTNGGQSYTAIEGNLAGTEQNPGPSLRAASILPGSPKTYFIATSIGLFSTTQINGSSTSWVQEGQSVMGNVVVSYVVSRKSDGRVVAGTHGRGAFVGSSGSGGAAALNLNVNQLNIEVLPNSTRSTNFLISNTGGADLSFNISASGGNSNVVENKPPQINLTPAYMMNNILKAQTIKKFKSQLNLNTNHSASSPLKVTADELVLDDGDAFADGYLGLGGTVYFYWRNDFQLTKDFSLEQVRFFMKTETANTNPMEIAVVSGTGTILVDTTFTTEVSSTGKWYDFQFPNNVLDNLKFKNGDTFSIVVISLNTNLQFPAGYDDDGQVQNQSYYAYYDPSFGGYFSGWANLNALAANGAWLIRAVGNSGGGTTNQPPVAVAQVSPNPAQINESVSFNGSGSYDNDGQVNSYLWEFGDNTTSNQSNATHSYSQAGQYNYKLTVTDDKGATNQAVGQINVSDQASPWTITPVSGNIPSGSQQNIKVTFNSQGLAEGNYQGQITVNSNGGNMVIPVSILVSSTVDVKDKGKILAYKLEQNYPNPFNPQTTIHWSIPTDNNVKLKVYDIEGKEIATLVDGQRNAGEYNTIFDAASLASGVYFYRMQAGNYVNTGKMILMK